MTFEEYGWGEPGAQDAWDTESYYAAEYTRRWSGVSATRAPPGLHRPRTESVTGSLADLADELEATARRYSLGRAGYRPPAYAPETVDELLMRVAEAYRILDELFGPRPAPRAAQEGDRSPTREHRPLFRP